MKSRSSTNSRSVGPSGRSRLHLGLQLLGLLAQPLGVVAMPLGQTEHGVGVCPPIESGLLITDPRVVKKAANAVEGNLQGVKVLFE